MRRKEKRNLPHSLLLPCLHLALLSLQKASRRFLEPRDAETDGWMNGHFKLLKLEEVMEDQRVEMVSLRLYGRLDAEAVEVCRR